MRVQREGDHIRLVMPGDITFISGQYTIQSHFYEIMGSVAKVIDEYDKTTVEVSGHTDSTGSTALNQKLSEQRANAVAGFLKAQGVNSSRIFTQGFGPRQPIAGNESSAGRRANRRVEIRLISRST